MRLIAMLLSTSLLGACATEHERLLASWKGVYAIERSTENPTGCDEEGLETDLGFGWLELDAEPGTQADLVELRPCAGADDCDRIAFFGFLTTKVTDGRLVGANDEVFWTGMGSGGLCQVLHERVVITRSGPDLSISIASGSATDVVAASEQVCLDLLEILAEDPDGCDAGRTIEARLVE